EPYSSCLERFQTPARPFYHKLRTHWIAVLGLLLAAIRLVGSLSRSKRLITMYKAVSPFALLPIVYTMVRFVADALSKVLNSASTRSTRTLSGRVGERVRQFHEVCLRAARRTVTTAAAGLASKIAAKRSARN
ncbi:hypothetical protein MRX96_046580, partial [Rhipicephalus microplus]